MLDLRDAILTIAVATTAAVPCSLLGCFLLLKRMSLLADAIGHGVLPGIAVAALWTGAVNGPSLIAGAIVFGILTAVFSEWLTQRAGVSADASLGVVFTALFSLGVVLISVFLGQAHLDLHCVAFSTLELTPLFTTTWFGVTVPEAIAAPMLVLGFVVLTFGLFWKEFQLATFDPGLATTMGMPIVALHYGLVSLTAGATVAGFEAFGSVLVLGMFVIPPATARLMTDRLTTMLFVSAGLAVTACVFGYALASPAVLGCNASGMIILAAGGQFLLALLFAPRHGVLAHGLRRFRLTIRMAEEEILATYFRAEETSQTPAAPNDHAFPPPILVLAHWNLSRKRLVDGRQLTEAGRRSAQSIVRAHRLWEAYLDRNFELPLDHLHASATEIEHFLGPELQAQVDQELARPGQDPHGKSIPDPR